MKEKIKNFFKGFGIENTKFHLWDVFLLFIANTSFIAVLSLAAHIFYAGLVVLLGLISTIVLLKILKAKVTLKDLRFDKWLFLILTLALIFRVPPYLYLMGGQDQGTYVNISKQYEISHSLYAIDHFRETLNKAEQELYDKYGNYLMPSIEKWNRTGSEYSMVFYPLHPAWMSIFGSLFGSDNRVYSLTMFSLISIISFYLLAYEISGKSKRAGYLIALFLAVSPLHAFFSKFPVSEMVALAFTSSSFYYLVKYYNNAKEGKPKYFYLVISALLMNAFFYTRMSSFLYIPFYYLIAVAVVIFIKPSQIKRHLFLYLASLLVLFLCSYYYYATYLTPLFNLIYSTTVEYYLNLYLPLQKVTNSSKLQIIGITSVIALALFSYLKNKKIFIKFVNLFIRFLPLTLNFIFILLIYITILDLLKMGYPITGPTGRYGYAGLGLLTIKHFSLFTILQYTGLFVFIFYFISNICIFIKKTNNPPFIFLNIFTLMFITIDSLLIKTVLYHYYFTRYYLTEAVPYLLLFEALFFSFYWKKNVLGYVVKTIVVLTMAYFSFFTAVQFFGQEMPKLNFYKEITNRVSQDDVLFIAAQTTSSKYENNFVLYVYGPLKWYYNLHTFVLGDIKELKDPNFTEQIAEHKKVFLLTNQEVPIANWINTKEIIRLEYNHFNVSEGCTYHNYEFLPIENIKQTSLPTSIKCLMPPNAYYTRYKDFYLYKLK